MRSRFWRVGFRDSDLPNTLGSSLRLSLPQVREKDACHIWRFTILDVPFGGSLCKGILLFGGLYQGSLSFVNSHIGWAVVGAPGSTLRGLGICRRGLMAFHLLQVVRWLSSYVRVAEHPSCWKMAVSHPKVSNDTGHER